MAEETEARRSPWNSLEVAKIVVGAATPVALAILGIAVNHSNEEAKTKRESALAAEKLKSDVRAQEIQRQAIVEAKEVEARTARERIAAQERAEENAAAREDHARREGYMREAQLRGESDAREALLRREAAAEARSNRALDKRIEAWSRSAPAVGNIIQRLGGIEMMLVRHGGNFPNNAIDESDTNAPMRAKLMTSQNC